LRGQPEGRTDEPTMTLAELANRLAIPPRQIRFMIAEGILPPAARTGRAADAYDEAHVTQGQRYLALHRMGMKPGSIKVLMAFDDAVPILQGHGVELRVDSQVLPAELDVDAILTAVGAALRAYTDKG
jgi:DNA-binding transcriptional MerR regulator